MSNTVLGLYTQSSIFDVTVTATFDAPQQRTVRTHSHNTDLVSPSAKHRLTHTTTRIFEHLLASLANRPTNQRTCKKVGYGTRFHTNTKPKCKPTVTDSDLRVLAVLFGPSLARALDLVHVGAVTCTKAEPSGRIVYTVAGNTPDVQHTVLPYHHCDCHAFQYELLRRGDALYVCCGFGSAGMDTRSTPTNNTTSQYPHSANTSWRCDWRTRLAATSKTLFLMPFLQPSFSLHRTCPARSWRTCARTTTWLAILLLLLLATTPCTRGDPLKMMADLHAADARSNAEAQAAGDDPGGANGVPSDAERLAQRLMVNHHHLMQHDKHLQHAVAHSKSYQQLVAFVVAAHLGGLTYWVVLFIKRRPGPDKRPRQPPKRVSCEYNM